MSHSWLYVSLKWATFALLFDAQDVCTDAPPIARWCVGKEASYLANYWRKRGAITTWLV